MIQWETGIIKKCSCSFAGRSLPRIRPAAKDEIDHLIHCDNGVDAYLGPCTKYGPEIPNEVIRWAKIIDLVVVVVVVNAIADGAYNEPSHIKVKLSVSRVSRR